MSLSLSLSVSLIVPHACYTARFSYSSPDFLNPYCHAFSHIEHKTKGKAGLWCIMSLAKA